MEISYLPEPDDKNFPDATPDQSLVTGIRIYERGRHFRNKNSLMLLQVNLTPR